MYKKNRPHQAAQPGASAECVSLIYDIRLDSYVLYKAVQKAPFENMFFTSYVLPNSITGALNEFIKTIDKVDEGQCP